MARLPDVQAFGARPIPDAVRPVAPISAADATAPADALTRLGRQVTDLGFEVQDRDATAAAKERDAWVSEQVRTLFYDPESGFMNKRGSGAVGAYGATQKALEKIKADATKGMVPLARRKLEAVLQSRMESALESMDRHTSGERRTWIEDASTARITAAQQDALFDVSGTSAHIETIKAELLGRAAREGWSDEVFDLNYRTEVSKVYRMQAARAADHDPVAALSYLEEHRDQMLPSDVAALESTLIPEAQRFLGRRDGAAAALGGVSNEYLSAIRSAESGGNDAAKNPLSSATGRYQFTAGTWLTVMNDHPELGLTADGRLDPAQQEKAIRAFTADNAAILIDARLAPTNANLYAAHFLGAHGATYALRSSDDTAMADVVGPGVIEANGFLAGMTVGDFKAWTARKAGGTGMGFSDSPEGLTAMLDRADAEGWSDERRKAAISEYELRGAVAAGEAKARSAAAQTAAIGIIEGGGNIWTDLSAEQRLTLGEDAIKAADAYQKMKAAGSEPVTDDATFYSLNLMMAQDPAGFAQTNLLAYRDKLSGTDFQELVRKQGAGAAEGVAASTLMETSARKIASAGIETGASAGEQDKARVATIQNKMLRWQDGFIKQNSRKPTPLEIDEEAGRQVLDIYIGGGSGANTRKRADFQIDDDITLERLTDGPITIGGVTVPQATIAWQVRSMKARGMDPAPEDVIDRLTELLRVQGLL
jgi:hypothetical protein